MKNNEQRIEKQYKPTSALRREMWNAAGYRERYAMQEGNANTYTENGYTFVKFTYGTKREYQDANGATYCVQRHAWVC